MVGVCQAPGRRIRVGLGLGLGLDILGKGA